MAMSENWEGQERGSRARGDEPRIVQVLDTSLQNPVWRLGPRNV